LRGCRILTQTFRAPMPPESLRFEFPAPVLRQPEGFRYHYLPLPPDIAEAFEAAGVKRVVTQLNGRTIRRAIQGNRDGERFLIFGLALLRDAGVAPEDVVILSIEPDPEPDRIDVPDELVEALAEDAEAGARFEAMTQGRQRGLSYYVDSAKRPETRVKRAAEIAYKLRTFTLHGDDGRNGAAE
jgi:hypothetical protein